MAKFTWVLNLAELKLLVINMLFAYGTKPMHEFQTRIITIVSFSTILKVLPQTQLKQYTHSPFICYAAIAGIKKENPWQIIM